MIDLQWFGFQQLTNAYSVILLFFQNVKPQASRQTANP